MERLSNKTVRDSAFLRKVIQFGEGNFKRDLSIALQINEQPRLIQR